MKKVHNPGQGANFQSGVGLKTPSLVELRQFANRIV